MTPEPTESDSGSPSPATGDLGESERRFRRLFEAARDGVLLIDPNSRKIVEANPFMHVLLGYTRAELLGKELFELGPATDAAASRTAFVKLQEQGYVRYENLPLESKSGQLREVEFVSNVYREGTSNIIQCNVRDISARRKAAREIAEKARLLDLSNDAIIVRDSQGNVQFWSEGATKLYGWSRAEAMGQPLHSLLQTAFPLPPTDLEAQLQRQGQFSGEVSQTGRDGRRLPSLCRLVLDRETGSVLASYTDISDRKAAELEMVHSRDKAIAASQAKDDFFATLSHELRTPLSPVLLMASDAANDLTHPPGTRDIFQMIERNVALEARLIDDLLDVTRINHAKMVLHPKPVDVYLPLRDAVATVQTALNEKNVRLTLDLAPGNPCVLGEAVRLQQIFWNVLRNAEKFTPSGGWIEVESHFLPNRRLEIKISDTGIGMTPQELGRIFVSFAQGDHAQGGGSRLFGGLGLGLSLARTLIGLHGGTIRAESPGLNQGSTFFIELPLLPAAGDPKPPQTGAGLIPAAPVDAGSAGAPFKRILLVEDHDATRRALAQLLTSRHYAVVSVASVAEAKLAVSQSRFQTSVSRTGVVMI